MQIADWIPITLSALLTLMVYSYLLRDNPLYRLAEHLLVAAGVAYALTVAVHAVLLPRLLLPLLREGTGRADLLIPLALGLLLLARALPRGSRLGNPGLAYLIGVGVALAVGGALVGTLLPQAMATMLPVLPSPTLSPQDALNNGLVVAGTVLVLLSFLYVRRSEPSPSERPALWRQPGRWFLMIALGSLFGGTSLTLLSLLAGRLDFLLNGWLRPLLGF